jgi:hypothetical protein
MEQWLLLTDYASKYRISVSTLRRRIKAGLQPHRFEDGRYYLPDQSVEPVLSAPMVQAAVQAAVQAPAKAISAQTPEAVLAAKIERADAAGGSEEPLITTTSRLLNELKQAYTLILHEKEEQIVYLKEEVADLKTLVHVLESENKRLLGRQVGATAAPEDRAPEDGKAIRRDPFRSGEGPVGNA